MTHCAIDYLRAAALAALLAGAPAALRAEDIDIFGRPPASNELPNILIIWDNSANWSANIPVPDCHFYENGVETTDGPKATSPDKEQGTKFAIEKCALYNVVDAMQPKSDADPARMNLGLVLFNESGAAQGGYPRRQFLPLTRANAKILKDTIKGIAINADKANNGPYTQALYEAYLMYARKAPYHGTLGTKWDVAAVGADGKYLGPPGNGCGVNNIIFLSNGSPNENNTDALSLLTGVGADTTVVTYAPGWVTNSDQADWADEFARFLRLADVSDMDGLQSIVTHAIAVIGSKSDGLYPHFIEGIAQQGGGGYVAASSVQEIVDFLKKGFNAIQAANSVFAAASLPISVNAQGSYKNQVFVGQFRPDASALPRWVGNLKQYQILYDPGTDTLSLGDSAGLPAINPSTGFFNPAATSFWTSDSSFWINDPKGTPASASDAPDGEVVEKGAVAQRLRTAYATAQDKRAVFTCLGCADGTKLTSSAATRFEANNASITAAMLGTTDATERTNIIDWVRGTDNRGDEHGPGGTTTVRPSVHGDVLHSRAAVVDFGGSVGTVAFYGANDGMLHAIDANKSGASAGRELWAFVPAELFGKLKRLRDNKPEVTYPITPPEAVTLPRDYFVDGSVTVYQKLDSQGATERVVIFATMRRGGRFLYAFDVTSPGDPVMLWRKSSGDSGMSALGQTWSDPRLALLKGNSGPVLVMGAGYDPIAEDKVSPTSPSMGNAVIVLDALSGSLLKTFGTDRPVPGAVALLDADFDGYVDRAYAADLGANVYRIDFENALGDGSTGQWRINKFASLGDAAKSRKFFYAPDLVQSRDFTAILIGTGDREKPLAPNYPANSVTNDRFYELFDYVGKGGPAGAPIMESQLAMNNTAAASVSGVAGCYMPLNSPKGEKVVTGAVSIGGYTYFSTNTPSDVFSTRACSTRLGIAKTYRLALFCGAAESRELTGGGLPPSPVAGIVEVTVPGSGGSGETTRQVPFIIGGFNPQLSGLQASRVPIVVDPTRRRTWWFTNKGH